MVDTQDEVDDVVSEIMTLLGQNEGMPQRIDTSDLPSDAQRAHQAITGSARLKVMRYLMLNPGATRKEIVDGADLNYISVVKALEVLIELEYVDQQTEGRAHFYTADRKQFASDFRSLVRWSLGTRSTGAAHESEF